MLENKGNKKKIRLDWKCGHCRKRFSKAELLEEGYAEKISSDMISIECPECGEQVIERTK